MIQEGGEPGGKAPGGPGQPGRTGVIVLDMAP
jgi:hypothetical protein